MARERKLDINGHLCKAGDFDFTSEEWRIVTILLRVGDAHDVIYPEVPRLPLFNKLNSVGLEVLYDGHRMYLSESSINNYFENIMGGTYEVEKSFVEKYSIGKNKNF
ncbi:hypothetical protein [Flavobacterium sp. 3-210]